ncbi:hypothetical protein MC7420_2056 [Coleofasciculus chthonoplastes PCC 7420]|uniref:Uncharacterized protein n=1 Tax=Coleofasciculus chthonoplastes PCC 7420 TaxID=118168 RepID=B4VSL2_9CYAN|nr:hypothetical protein MC7420_2056 [Coleofasciculus chthonoplastes PCC 7420]
MSIDAVRVAPTVHKIPRHNHRVGAGLGLNLESTPLTYVQNPPLIIGISLICKTRPYSSLNSSPLAYFVPHRSLFPA